ncbi:MAG: phosphoribosyl-AMP cyclohydrolase [Methermicoccaceae archaeon]
MSDEKVELKFDERGLIPVVAYDIDTKEVLMLAWADARAVELTLSTGYAHYFSRSRRQIWKKGESSGMLQRVHRVLVDCDNDTLMYEASQKGGACHMGYRSCFYRTLDGEQVSRKVFEPEEVYR